MKKADELMLYTPAPKRPPLIPPERRQKKISSKMKSVSEIWYTFCVTLLMVRALKSWAA